MQTLTDHVIAIVRNHSTLTNEIMRLVSEAARSGKVTVDSFELIELIQKDTEALNAIQENLNSKD